MNKVFLMILFAAAAARGQPPWYSAEWAKIKDAMGPIDFDGRLAMSFPVDRIDADGLSWDVSLDHTVDLDAYNAPTSRWIVQGLACSLAPEARGSLRALLPSGRLLHFARNKDESEPIRDKGGNWSLKKEGQGYVIESPLGNRYFFVRGQLARLVTIHGRKWTVKAEAGHIRSIADGDARAIVSCDYDPAGEPVAVKFAGGNHGFTWENGLLIEWNAGVRGRTRFEYLNRMVACVRMPKSPPVSIEWASVPDWNRVSDVWWSPVRVSRVDNRSFAYDLGHDGDRFTVTDEATGVRTVTRFNWLSQVVAQQVGGGEPVIAKYNPALVRPGYFISIGPANGRSLEKYDYDARKRLVKITKTSNDGTQTQITGREKITDGWDGEAQPGMPIYEN